MGVVDSKKLSKIRGKTVKYAIEVLYVAYNIIDDLAKMTQKLEFKL